MKRLGLNLLLFLGPLGLLDHPRFQVGRNGVVVVEFQCVGSPALRHRAKVLGVPLDLRQRHFRLDQGGIVSRGHSQNTAAFGVEVAHHLAGVPVGSGDAELHDGFQ